MKKRSVSSEKNKIEKTKILKPHTQGKGARKGMRIVRSPQYKLYKFIDDHFKGNLSMAARFIGTPRSKFNTLVNHGNYSMMMANRVVSALSKIDPSVTYESLFIPEREEPIPKKEPLILPDPIKPTKGNHQIAPKTKFSEILSRYK